MQWGCIKCGVEIPQDTEYCAECEEKQFRKIGGFLYLPLISLFIHAVSNLAAIYDAFKYLIENYDYLSFDVRLFFAGTALICFILFLATAYIIPVFLKRKKQLPKLYICLYISIILLTSLNVYMLYALIPGVTIGYDELSPVLRLVISSCIWIPYFIKSERVKRTFVN